VIDQGSLSTEWPNETPTEIDSIAQEIATIAIGRGRQYSMHAAMISSPATHVASNLGT
jgi:hypothetical protein